MISQYTLCLFAICPAWDQSWEQSCWGDWVSILSTQTKITLLVSLITSLTLTHSCLLAQSIKWTFAQTFKAAPSSTLLAKSVLFITMKVSAVSRNLWAVLYFLLVKLVIAELIIVVSLLVLKFIVCCAITFLFLKFRFLMVITLLLDFLIGTNISSFHSGFYVPNFGLKEICPNVIYKKVWPIGQARV